MEKIFKWNKNCITKFFICSRLLFISNSFPTFHSLLFILFYFLIICRNTNHKRIMVVQQYAWLHRKCCKKISAPRDSLTWFCCEEKEMKYRPASITVINFVFLYTQVETKQEYEEYFWVLVGENVVELFLFHSFFCSWK